MDGYRKKALFLDRDGVINFDAGYTYRKETFEFIPGIFELCLAAQDLGYLLIVVTNQAGIARGYYSETDFHDLTGWMVEQFAGRNVQITRVYHCPYHPVFGVGKYKYDSPDRKPNPGMLIRAQADLNLDLPGSILIGDKVADIEAGSAAGVGIRILLSTDGSAAGQPDTSYQAKSLDEIRSRFFPQPGSLTAGDRAGTATDRP